MLRKLILTIIGVALAVGANAATLTESLDKSYDVRPGTAFKLSNVNGAVEVHAWDQPRIHITATKKVESRDADDAKAAMRELKIEITQSASGFNVNTQYPNRDGGIFDWLTGSNVNMQVHYTINVPRQMSLGVETVNGSLSIEGVSGTMKLETVNGAIELVRCGGKVDAETTNGAIRAQLATVTPNQPMRFETTNGRITLEVPATYAARIDAETTNGGIKSDLPIVTSRVERNSLRGTLNRGTADLILRTTNGGIELRNGSAAR
jgi:DUF4097 and DUF4098 domain-containing protein YvlB